MKASIMIPAYNVERFLSETLESALNQNFKDYEILIVNDGSTDDTKNIIDFYAKKDKRIRRINQENRGVSAARNRLLEESKGEFLIELDADDRLYPNSLEKVIDYFERNPDFRMVYTDNNEINENGQVVKTSNKKELHAQFNELILHHHFPGHLKAFRKSKIKRCKFDVNLPKSEDYDFLLKVIMKDYPNFKMGYISEILYDYRKTLNGLDKNVKSYSATILEKHTRENKVYGDKDFEIVPIDAGGGIIYYEHVIDGEKTMKPEVREALLNYLRAG